MGALDTIGIPQTEMIGLLSAAPFVVCAVFLLFHLGWNARLEPAQRSRRVAGPISESVGLMIC